MPPSGRAQANGAGNGLPGIELCAGKFPHPLLQSVSAETRPPPTISPFFAPARSRPHTCEAHPGHPGRTPLDHHASQQQQVVQRAAQLTLQMPGARRPCSAQTSTQAAAPSLFTSHDSCPQNGDDESLTCINIYRSGGLAFLNFLVLRIPKNSLNRSKNR